MYSDYMIYCEQVDGVLYAVECQIINGLTYSIMNGQLQVVCYT